MNAQRLIETARVLVAGDKGLLAMDESTPTCNKRFARLGIRRTEETRRAYREWTVTTPGLAECISGVILYDETIRERTKNGTAFATVRRLLRAVAAAVPGSHSCLAASPASRPRPEYDAATDTEGSLHE